MIQRWLRSIQPIHPGARRHDNVWAKHTSFPSQISTTVREQLFVSHFPNHRVLQALAAERFVANALPSDHRAPLRWLNPGACDAVVALAIYHTLRAVNVLDEEATSDPDAVSRAAWRTELKPGHHDLDGAARGLIEGLVDRLSQLPKKRSARDGWVNCSALHPTF